MADLEVSRPIRGIGLLSERTSGFKIAMRLSHRRDDGVKRATRPAAGLTVRQMSRAQASAEFSSNGSTRPAQESSGQSAPCAGDITRPDARLSALKRLS